MDANALEPLLHRLYHASHLELGVPPANSLNATVILICPIRSYAAGTSTKLLILAEPCSVTCRKTVATDLEVCSSGSLSRSEHQR